jgi:hypothetical protein
MSGVTSTTLGWVLIVIGVGLTATLFGAILGIPAIIFGIVLLVVGNRKRAQVYTAIVESGARQTTEYVATLVKKELAARQLQPRSYAACGHQIDDAAAAVFCPVCGAKVRQA